MLDVWHNHWQPVLASYWITSTLANFGFGWLCNSNSFNERRTLLEGSATWLIKSQTLNKCQVAPHSIWLPPLIRGPFNKQKAIVNPALTGIGEMLDIVDVYTFAISVNKDLIHANNNQVGRRELQCLLFLFFISLLNRLHSSSTIWQISKRKLTNV